jgi:tripartite-type tricarboxylate transporter receptor subunit TctC
MTAASTVRLVSEGALRLALCAAAVLAAGHGCAREFDAFPAYPVKSIRIITASSPGAAEDFFARSIGKELSAFYGRGVFIENRSGAGGLIGNELVSKAKSDGYTLGMISVSRIIRELMHERPPYRSLADIAGVAHVASITNVLAVATSLPVRSATQFVAYARPRFGELNYASLGIGSASHLAGELFTRAVGIEAIHVPFRMLSDSFTEMVLGRVHYTVQTLPAVLGPVLDGRLRALAVMTPHRSPALPGVPAIAEFGLPEAQFDSWSGIVVPTGTPRRIVEQLHGDIVRALRKPALRELFVSQGAESMPESTPESFTRMMQNEYLRYRALIRYERVTPI